MLTTGEFSRLCLVTRKTLRHYDTIGLLRPIREANGYRYYEPAQIRDMRLIQRLKAYGFTLPEIAAVLARQGDAAYLAERLREKQSRMQGHLTETERLLGQLARDADSATKGEDIMKATVDVQMKKFDPVTIYSIRKHLGTGDFSDGVAEAFKGATQAGFTVSGPAVFIYHDEDFRPEHADVEFGFVVDGAGQGTRTLDPGLCAMVHYVGAYDETFAELYTQIAQWITENDYRMSGPVFDVYLRSVNEPDLDPSEYVTELWFPIVKA